MTFTQRIAPNLGQKSGAGDCLWFTWQAFGAPPGLGFGYAREAWDGQHGRHPGELPPVGVMVPVWFDHYGTYGSPPRYGNWGHAAISLGDGRILSSPDKAGTFGQTIFASISDLERRLGATYLGWSECMDDTPVVVPAPKPKPAPEPTPTIGDLMAFKSTAIGYRPDEDKDRVLTTALDFEHGQRLSEVAMTKDSAVAFFGKLTDGGFSILSSKGHYDKVIAEFDAAVAEKRAHELAVARAAAGK